MINLGVRSTTSGQGCLKHLTGTSRCWMRVGSATELLGFIGNVETTSLVM